ncbi:UNVERIFIED_CONTAM: hypothetical protein HDU68_009046 [Siphonaria sp. JEL0065]|nr:hypothetical protein HDU68_009046 [Siphonaria sp. JEL0065]
MWYLKLDASKDTMTISLGRKQSPYSPYHDTRIDIRFWCRITCYAASTSAVTDAYTFEVPYGLIGSNATVALSGGSPLLAKSLLKELAEYNQTIGSDGDGGANLRIAVVLGVL